MTLSAENIADRVIRSPKYRCLCRDTVLRAAALAAARSGSAPEAVKRARRKLHQVHGAYLSHWNAKRAAELMDEIRSAANPNDLKRACMLLMQIHESSAGRIDSLDRLFPMIYESTGVPDSILDLGCGLQPFALPWMGLKTGAEYVACEIDNRLVDLVNDFFDAVGQKGKAACRDVLADLPKRRVDMAFLLQMLPCLEQQEKGSAGRVLRKVNAEWILVSYPLKSLSGRERGMGRHYPKTMEAILDDLSLPCRSFRLGEELFYLLDRRDRT